MNKEIIKKAVIVAVIITLFSIIITGWIDYQKHKDYEAMKGDMIQSANKQTQDTTLVKLDIVKESITNTGVTMIITDHNKNPYGWGPGYELLKLVNDEQWIPVDALVPLSFHEIAYVLDENNQWITALEIKDNHQRFIKHTLNKTAKAVRFIPLSTYHSETKTEDYGSSTAHIFNFEVY